MPSTNNPSSGDSVSRSMPFHPVGCHHERSNNRYPLLSPRCRTKMNSGGRRGNGTELHEDTELPVAVGRRNDGRNGGDTCGRRRTTNAVMCVPSAGRGGRVENNNVSYSKTSSSSAVNDRSSTSSVIMTQQGPPPPPFAGRGQQQRNNQRSAQKNGNKKSSSSTPTAAAQPQQQTIDPKNWAQSLSKAFLRKELLNKDSIYWKLTSKEAYASKPDLFNPFKYENFVTNFRNLKNSIQGEMKAIFFDDEAVKKELISFPPSEVDRRGNKRFHTHPAKQLLTDDIKNGAGETYFNRPRDLRKTRDEYMEFNQIYFRKAFNRQKQREKEEVGWQFRRNVAGAKNNLQSVSESSASADI